MYVLAIYKGKVPFYDLDPEKEYWDFLSLDPQMIHHLEFAHTKEFPDLPSFSEINIHQLSDIKQALAILEEHFPDVIDRYQRNIPIYSRNIKTPDFLKSYHISSASR